MIVIIILITILMTCILIVTYNNCNIYTLFININDVRARARRPAGAHNMCNKFFRARTSLILMNNVYILQLLYVTIKIHVISIVINVIITIIISYIYIYIYV